MASIILSCILFLFATSAVQGRYAHPSSLHRGITVVKVVATWEEAKQHCERDGTILASPLNTDLLNYMTSHIGVHNHSSTYFIGMKARNGPQLQFVSIEGTELDDLPEEVKDMIDQIDPRDGDCLSMDQNTIRTASCWERLPFLCYTTGQSQQLTTSTSTSTSTTTPVPTVINVQTDSNSQSQESNEDCGGGYKRYSGSCYKPHEERLTWIKANRVCNSEGGYLVVINDTAELQVVMAIRPNNSVWTWVGLRKGADREWRTVLGTPIDSVYNVWAEDRYNKNKCGFLRPSGGLDDLKCNENAEPFLCEKSLS